MRCESPFSPASMRLSEQDTQVSDRSIRNSSALGVTLLPAASSAHSPGMRALLLHVRARLPSTQTPLLVLHLPSCGCRWYWAVRKVILKRRSSLSAERMESRLLLRKAALPFTSFVGMKTVGPQLVACCYLPPAEKYPGHPEYRPAPPARLQIQVILGPPTGPSV